MRALIIEDDQLISDFISAGLKEAGYTCTQCGDGVSGLDAAVNDGYDVAIVDLMLPGLDGMSIIDTMRQRKIDTPVVILSARKSLDDRIQGLRSGGDDYLTKPFSVVELLARIEAILRRVKQFDNSSTLTVGDLEMDLLSRCVKRNGKRIHLQPKEFSLLEYLIRNRGQVVSKTMIMERVWNYHFDPCTNVVEARISKLREKVDKEFESPLIHTVRGAGYILSHDYAAH